MKNTVRAPQKFDTMAASPPDAGMIAAKGLVNSREHFESLIVARETGYATIQSYLKSQSEAA